MGGAGPEGVGPEAQEYTVGFARGSTWLRSWKAGHGSSEWSRESEDEMTDVPEASATAAVSGILSDSESDWEPIDGPLYLAVRGCRR